MEGTLLVAARSRDINSFVQIGRMPDGISIISWFLLKLKGFRFAIQFDSYITVNDFDRSRSVLVKNC